MQGLRESRLIRMILPVYRRTSTKAMLTRGSLEVLVRAFRVEHEDFGAIIFVLGLAWRHKMLGALLYAAERARNDTGEHPAG